MMNKIGFTSRFRSLRINCCMLFPGLIDSSRIENNIPLYTFKEMIEKGIAVPINNIFFDSGLSELKDYSLPELKRISKIIIENNLTVELSGHTDNIDTEEFNLKLNAALLYFGKVLVDNVNISVLPGVNT